MKLTRTPPVTGSPPSSAVSTGVGGLSLLLLLAGGCTPGSPAEPANVLLISIDTLRADHLGYHGYSRATSPFLDRLAGTSTSFERAISSSSWTLPAHASLFLSQDSSVHGVTNPNKSISGEATTLAEILQQLGFRTAGFYSAPLLASKYGFSQGFEIYDRVEDPGLDRSTPIEEKRIAEEINDDALRWLDGLEDQRFFLFLHYFDVHAPYAARLPDVPSYCPPGASGRDYVSIAQVQTGRYLEMHGVAEGVVAEGSNTRQTARALESAGYGHLVQGFVKAHKLQGEQVSTAERQCLIGLYDDGIRYLDSQLERLFEELRRRGILDRTLVILTSDHGETLFERDHRRGHGESLYQADLHVPLLISTPGPESGRRLKEWVSTLDVLPTILDYLNADPPPNLQGRSLKPLIEGHGSRAGAVAAELVGRRSKSGSGEPDQWALIRSPWKLIATDDRLQLFDLLEDPGETIDLASREPDKLAELRRLLRERLRAAESLRSRLESPEVELTAEEIRELRALGYLN